MSEFKLHCFALSGNAYKVALFLTLAQKPWEAVFVDFLNGETKTQAWRDTVNEQGEVPVLEHRGQRLSQSALILDYLAEVTGQFGAQTPEEKQEIWRWMLFDNHKFTSYYATLRFLYGIQKSGETDVTRFLRERARAAYQVVDAHLAKTPFLVGERLTIADLSLAGYVFMPEDTGLDMHDFPHVQAWKARIQILPGWQHPYDLMPGPTSL
ncbi:glutathione S-transferase [Pseudomonas sp. DTU_2021_1001937_2_SI_NGA_ILE_001]|uniref:glutathione S-transferase family protein n=1 Tax=Pseudomonas sp. DTU_2021_1001937_2_SI_NGA_ILE_001 TaxID=3077589 RepID=UPI0028FC0F0B|nr:glutathione S-transferase [Pseudomonas sp. DTU_2021_1001937_2_SI_NGA_ILE_001]WNW09977.1 glutathione S-transferase [Pseudomonas sp. DTU_2021_1001937_2_SI_NGA_ILE_001]